MTYQRKHRKNMYKLAVHLRSVDRELPFNINKVLYMSPFYLTMGFETNDLKGQFLFIEPTLIQATRGYVAERLHWIVSNLPVPCNDRGNFIHPADREFLKELIRVHRREYNKNTFADYHKRQLWKISNFCGKIGMNYQNLKYQAEKEK